MAQFIRSRLARGATEEEILTDFQASIEGTDADRGYVCLIDQNDSGFLCHPMQSMIGINISVKNAEFDTSFQRQNPIPWEIAIKNPKSSSGLLLINNASMEEVVYSEVIPELGWVVNSHENTQRVQDEIATYRLILLFGSGAFALLLAFPVSFAVRRVSRSYEKVIEKNNIMLADERQKSDQLLLSILPKAIADRMKQGEKNIVNHFPKVAILFCDIVGFTQLSSRNSAEKIAKLLSILFSQFDKLCTKHGVEKIKTIGDAYLAVCGLPLPDMDPASKIVPMALDMRAFVASQPWGIKVRIGIHMGEAAAGVIGTQKFSYDLWGDAVNVAARLESTGIPGKIQISSPVKDALGDNGWTYEDQGEKELKGKGKVQTWLVEPQQ
jgi:class 3 adenylate cyclase